MTSNKRFSAALLAAAFAVPAALAGRADAEVIVRGGQEAGPREAFKAGLTVHLEVVNGGHMAMRSDASLKGFTKAFTGL